MTERLHLHFSLSCTGEGNGNPLQCSCLENPRDGGAWLAAVYGVAQSRTRLKRLSSSRGGWIFLMDYGFYFPYDNNRNPMDRGAWWAIVHGVTKELDTTEQVSSCIHFREGNGNPLQYSCLENPMDGGAW